MSCCLYRYIPFPMRICFRLTSRVYARVHNYWIPSAELLGKLCGNTAEPNTKTVLTKICESHWFYFFFKILLKADMFVLVMWLPGDRRQPCQNKSKAEIKILFEKWPRLQLFTGKPDATMRLRKYVFECGHLLMKCVCCSVLLLLSSPCAPLPVPPGRRGPLILYTALPTLHSFITPVRTWETSAEAVILHQCLKWITLSSTWGIYVRGLKWINTFFNAESIFWHRVHRS